MITLEQCQYCCLFSFVLLLNSVNAYFTLPGKCPENVKLQEDFRLAEFFDPWYQAYYFSSDKLKLNNCSRIDLQNNKTGIHVKLTRVDRGLFERYSRGRLVIPTDIEKASSLEVEFFYKDAPRRLMTRKYPFYILATNYKYYATVYTCQYSPLIDKHFIYVWLLSRTPSLNVVSKELAIEPLRDLGIGEQDMIKDNGEDCHSRYTEDKPVEPTTFRHPVPI